ncbi:cation transporter [Sporomusa sphaeroides DSM 2875]|uniref:CopZ family metallochaperone n=1 Tax=Sporomusa sphaeroides TaxID=47679 RepID=UPI00202E42E3|nr:cation transporter [Sporomusa sphaeroides DSM 2875]
MSQEETILKIEGMSCGHCKMSVEKALQAIPGVVSASVDLAKKEAHVTGTANRVALVKAVEEAGFDVV